MTHLQRFLHVLIAHNRWSMATIRPLFNTLYIRFVISSSLHKIFNIAKQTCRHSYLLLLPCPLSVWPKAADLLEDWGEPKTPPQKPSDSWTPWVVHLDKIWICIHTPTKFLFKPLDYIQLTRPFRIYGYYEVILRPPLAKL